MFPCDSDGWGDGVAGGSYELVRLAAKRYCAAIRGAARGPQAMKMAMVR
jgi:hypothetical protein